MDYMDYATRKRGLCFTYNERLIALFTSTTDCLLCSGCGDEGNNACYIDDNKGFRDH